MTIYKDKHANKDDESCPSTGRKYELCLNCGFAINNSNEDEEHYGWACPQTPMMLRKPHLPTDGDFSKTPPHQRYETHSMRDSLTSSRTFPIYFDAFGHLDNEVEAASRPGRCLNCGEVWGNHGAWACGESSDSFFELDPENRFLTRAMKDSLSSKEAMRPHDTERSMIASKPVVPSVDLTDWKTWAKRPAGECPCAISAKDCRYHSG